MQAEGELRDLLRMAVEVVDDDDLVLPLSDALHGDPGVGVDLQQVRAQGHGG